MATWDLRNLLRTFTRDPVKFARLHQAAWLVFQPSSDPMAGYGADEEFTAGATKPRIESAPEELAAELVRASGSITPGTAVAVGRNSKADVVIDDEHVSRVHALFQRNGNGLWTLSDAESANGTKLGGRPVIVGKPQLLGDRAELDLGGLKATFFTAEAFERHLASLRR